MSESVYSGDKNVEPKVFDLPELEGATPVTDHLIGEQLGRMLVSDPAYQYAQRLIQHAEALERLFWRERKQISGLLTLLAKARAERDAAERELTTARAASNSWKADNVRLKAELAAHSSTARDEGYPEPAATAPLESVEARYHDLLARLGVTGHDGAVAEIESLRSSVFSSKGKLWLWKNFVNGRPEYLAFDNPYPCHPNGDPMTLGEPCGYALFMQSTTGRTDVPESQVIEAIKRARPSTPSSIERDAVIEECAKVCDALRAKWDTPLGTSTWKHAFEDAAKEIRALKEARPEAKKPSA